MMMMVSSLQLPTDAVETFAVAAAVYEIVVLTFVTVVVFDAVANAEDDYNDNGDGDVVVIAVVFGVIFTFLVKFPLKFICMANTLTTLIIFFFYYFLKCAC